MILFRDEIYEPQVTGGRGRKKERRKEGVFGGFLLVFLYDFWKYRNVLQKLYRTKRYLVHQLFQDVALSLRFGYAVVA